MARNKSFNEDNTRDALKVYFEEAKSKGLLPSLLACGVSEGAIKTAIQRGRISANMIDGLVQVLGADRDALMGVISISEAKKIEETVSSPYGDEEIKEEIDSYIETLFPDKLLGIPCRRLVRRTIRYIEIIALNQHRRKGDAAEAILFKERALIDEAFSDIAKAFSLEVKDS